MQHWWFPTNASSFGGDVDRIFYIILYITGAVFVLVEVGLLVFLVRYRRREGRTATYTHGSTTAEIVWTTIPAVTVICLALVSQRVWSAVKDPASFPRDAVPLGVHAKQFEWQFTMPGPDGRLGTDDDVFRKNELHLQVGRSYAAALTAQDVIHSFFIPAFRLKQDAVPGMTITVWFRPTAPGVFDLACAELCGVGHYRMGAKVYVHTAEEFARWQAAQAAPTAPDTATARQGSAS
ncbi:MAG: cytochrome c oxidase subunit II [Gemmatimonadota bacterium]